MLQRYFKYLFTCPCCLFQSFLLVGVAQHHKLNFTEHHLHKIGLRACPSAEQSSESRCKKNDEENESDHGQAENEKILRPENIAKYNEFTFWNIEHKQW